VATVALVAVPASAVAVVLPDPGRAVDDTLTVQQDGSGGLDVLTNDVINFGGIVLEPLGLPAHGRTEGRRGSPGWFDYYPSPGYAGSDSFSYRLTFDDGSTSTGTVRVTVVAVVRTTSTTTSTTRAATTTTRPASTTTTRGTTRARTTTSSRRGTTTTTTTRRTTTTTTTTGAPRPPVAADDSVAADFSTTVVIPVLANDRDPDGTLVPGSVVVVTTPLHGTATVNPDGTISYTAGLDDTAFSDRLVYRVSDDSGATAQARVEIGLREPDDLLGGKTSSAPGATLQVTGTGCGDRGTVRIELDGAVTGQTVSLPDGGFSTDLPAPDRLGRYRLRAVCDGHAMQSWLDVVQTTSADGGGRAGVAAGVLATVGAVLTFYLLSGFLLAPPARRRRPGTAGEVDELELGGWGRG
jgi:hypothetical protein